MRTLKTITRILAATALLIATVVSPAEAHAVDTASNTQLSRNISSQLSLPSDLVQPNFNAEIQVDFKIHPDGTVEVIRVHTDNLLLKDHVIKQFNAMRLHAAASEQVYRIPVKYRVV